MSAPLSGQIIITASAQALSTAITEVSGWSLKAPLTNGHPVFMGSSTVTVTSGHQLDPGDTFEYELRNVSGLATLGVQPSDIYVVGTAGAGDIVSWFASP